jgi:hypothetical protein
MLYFPCVSLTNLSKMVGERYNTRSKILVQNLPDPHLLNVENDIIRMNKLITIHRRHCRHCKLREIRVSRIFKGSPSSTIIITAS